MGCVDGSEPFQDFFFSAFSPKRKRELRPMQPVHEDSRAAVTNNNSVVFAIGVSLFVDLDQITSRTEPTADQQPPSHPKAQQKV